LVWIGLGDKQIARVRHTGTEMMVQTNLASCTCEFSHYLQGEHILVWVIEIAEGVSGSSRCGTMAEVNSYQVMASHTDVRQEE
jgi:hypothetical protein